MCKFADCGAPSGLGGRKYILAMLLNAFVMGDVEVLTVKNLLQNNQRAYKLNKNSLCILNKLSIWELYILNFTTQEQISNPDFEGNTKEIKVFKQI